MKKIGMVFGILWWTAIGLAFPGPDSGEFQETRLTDRVLILYHAPWAETMTVVDAGPSLIVVDTWGSLAAAKKARGRIEEVFHKPVRFVINTHHHWDHTFGNAAFPGAEIVGHRFCAEDMKTDYAEVKKRKEYFLNNAANTQWESVREYILQVGGESSQEGFRLLLPSHLVRKTDALRIGDLTLRLYHTAGLHTRSNLTIFIPELGILFGRSGFANASELVLESGADPKPIAGVLKSILALNKPIRVLIPGHGEPEKNPDLNPAINRLTSLIP